MSIFLSDAMMLTSPAPISTHGCREALMSLLRFYISQNVNTMNLVNMQVTVQDFETQTGLCAAGTGLNITNNIITLAIALVITTLSSHDEF